MTEPRRLSDIARLIRIVGALAGTEAAAEAAAAAFERELEALRARYSARAPVRVFYEIWHRPLLTVNGAHLISDVIALCGGLNVFADAPVLTPSVSLEAVLAARPEVVLGGSSATTPGRAGAGVAARAGRRVARIARALRAARSDSAADAAHRRRRARSAAIWRRCVSGLADVEPGGAHSLRFIPCCHSTSPEPACAVERARGDEQQIGKPVEILQEQRGTFSARVT